MKLFFEKVRTPKKDMSLKIQIMVTIGIIVFGFALGVFQKWMDGSANNLLPLLLQQLDIRNYFGRLAIWILLATVISVYSKSPLRPPSTHFRSL